MVTDPCVRADELRAVREKLIMGQGVAQADTGDGSVSYTKADLPRLDRLIAEYDDQCAALNGTKPVRRRHAMGARFRPY